MIVNKNVKSESFKFFTVLLFGLSIICGSLFFNCFTAYADDFENEDVKTVISTSESKSTKNDYVLTLIERGNIKEKIKGSEIGLRYVNNQSKEVTFQDDLLKNAINKLSCFDEKNIIESKNAKLEYAGNQYVIRKEIYGTEIDKDILYNNIVSAIKSGKTKLDLNAAKCYKDPKYLDSSQKVIDAQKILNKYVSSKISYYYGTDGSVLDGETIKDWIYINGEYDITILEGKVREYVDSIASNYRSSLGHSIPVSGGSNGNNHSWYVDAAAETEALIQNIKNGDNISKNPVFAQNSYASYFSNLGDTFVEVDMGNQYLWFYKNGYVVAEGDIVTGNMSESGCATPSGVYTLKNKQKDAVLVGDNYQTPVSFWMPFIGNSIGLHDANWRWNFGGEIYKTNGSHGCVNLPYSLAESIYNNISIGTSVITYY